MRTIRYNEIASFKETALKVFRKAKLVSLNIFASELREINTLPNSLSSFLSLLF
jgi:hypothetical protein